MRYQIMAAALAAALSLAAVAARAQPPQPDAYLGEVRAFSFNYCPVNWLPADGRLMPVGPNPRLYALLGAYYGGDGKTTFALPNLQGATPIGKTGQPGPRASAGSGGNTRFLAMTWCIAVQGTFPQKP